MNSIEFTKIVGVLLTVALVVSLSNFIANEIFPRHHDEVRAYVVAAAEAEPAARGWEYVRGLDLPGNAARWGEEAAMKLAAKPVDQIGRASCRERV
jgi:hypothetical protein